MSEIHKRKTQMAFRTSHKFIKANHHNDAPPQNPSHVIPKGYSPYKPQSKTNPLLNKLESDSGYPQSIVRGGPAPKSHRDHVSQNRKGLKNYFQDRIPVETTTIKEWKKANKYQMDIKKIFEGRRLQNTLKGQTKITLGSSFTVQLRKNQGDSQVNSSQLDAYSKMHSSFHIHDKTNARTSKMQSSQHRMVVGVEAGNYRRGTVSHIGQRKKLIKKDAYEKVFGPDISGIPRKRTAAGGDRMQEEMKQQQQQREQMQHQPHQALTSNPHETLHNLIHKLTGYKAALSNQPPGDIPPKVRVPSPPPTMITLIQNLTHMYKGAAVDGRKKINELEDIRKIDQQYYVEMQQWKQRRLQRRMEDIRMMINNEQEMGMDGNQHSMTIGGTGMNEFDRREISNTLEMEMEMEMGKGTIRAQDLTIIQGDNHKLTARSKFVSFQQSLIKLIYLVNLYGINPRYIADAFKNNRQPYEMEGSYAMFKCIQLGDFPGVKVFIDRDPKYVFQVKEGRMATLAYASKHNQPQILSLILSVGVNVDAEDQSSHTALYYAILTENTSLVRLLLQRGASPWSTASNKYSSIVKPGAMAQLMSNAKKIYIGMQMQYNIKQKKEYWANNKHKIDIGNQNIFNIPEQ